MTFKRSDHSIYTLIINALSLFLDILPPNQRSILGFFFDLLLPVSRPRSESPFIFYLTILTVMKKYYNFVWVLLFVVNGNNSFAQNHSKNLYSEMHSSFEKENISFISLFERNTSAKSNYNFKELIDFEILALDLDALQNLRSTQNVVQIELGSDETILHLEPTEILGSSYQLLNSKDQITTASKSNRFFRGYVKGFPNSLASMSITSAGVRILYSSPKSGNVNIYKISEDRYIKYNDSQRKNRASFSCSTNDSYDLKREIEEQANRIVAGNCVEIYLEADYRSYLDNNSSISDTEDWLQTIFNDVATLYANDGINISLASVKVWNAPDPYQSSSNIVNVLTLFGHQVKDNYTGRLAHLISTRSLGGGIAWVNVLCAKYDDSDAYGPYGVSASLTTNTTPLPDYSWNVNVLAHELGHNFGSRHTHDCVWNGNDTQIDDCGNQAGYSTGSCYSASSPIIPASGTIMSYCHLNGAGIDFSQGFGSQPSALMLSKFNSSACATGCISGVSCSDGIHNGDEEAVDCGGCLCPDCPTVANDDCALATDISHLLPNGSQTFPNGNLLASAGSLRPTNSPYSGCATFMSWCNNSNNNDVWYRVTIPTGNTSMGFLKVSTRGTEFDSQVAIWADCSVGKMLSANDDYWPSADNYTSLTTAAVKPGNVYYIQVDGYSNSERGAIEISLEYVPLTGTSNYGSGNVQADWEATDEDGWTHYINSSLGKVLLSINREGNNIGWLGKSPSTSCTLRSNTGALNLGMNGCGAPYTMDQDWWVLRRTWNFDPLLQPQSDVRVRSYYSTSDFNAVSAVMSAMSNHEDLIHYKVTTNEDLTDSNNSCHEQVSPSDYKDYPSSDYTYGQFEDDHYAEYTVSDLLAGGGIGASSGGTALPVTIIQFEGEAQVGRNKIHWATASEKNNEWQILERAGEDLLNWAEVGRIKGTNTNETKVYTLFDERPLSLGFYRLRLKDYDGQEYFSNIIALEKKDLAPQTRVYPNPTSKDFTLEYHAPQKQSIYITLYDIKGSKLIFEEIKVEEGLTKHAISLENYPKGVYQLLLDNGDFKEVLRISKS